MCPPPAAAPSKRPRQPLRSGVRNVPQVWRHHAPPMRPAANVVALINRCTTAVSGHLLCHRDGRSLQTSAICRLSGLEGVSLDDLTLTVLCADYPQSSFIRWSALKYEIHALWAAFKPTQRDGRVSWCLRTAKQRAALKGPVGTLHPSDKACLDCCCWKGECHHA